MAAWVLLDSCYCVLNCCWNAVLGMPNGWSMQNGIYFWVWEPLVVMGAFKCLGIFICMFVKCCFGFKNEQNSALEWHSVCPSSRESKFESE